MSIFGGRQPGQPRYSGQLHNMSVTEAVFGTVLPIVVGTQRVHGKLLDYNGFTVTQVSAGGGKGIFGGKGQEANYAANVAIALAQGPCKAILNIWDQQGALVNENPAYSFVVPSGGGSVQPQSGANKAPIQSDIGVTMSQAYSVTATDYGSSGPVTHTGTQQVPLTRVSGTPTTANQYAFDPATGTYTFPAAAAGQTVSIVYTCAFSLYYFEQVQAAEIPLGSPYQVSTDNQPYFAADNGVTFVDTGAPLTPVSGTPTVAGTYNENVGFYTFAPADAGRYVYIRYTYSSSDANVTNTSTLNLTFFNGAQGQAPWSFFVSNYPSSAFGYSGICYVGAAPLAMGDSPTLPSYNYELYGQCTVPGQLDADVTQAINLLLTDSMCGVGFPLSAIPSWNLAQSYWGANGFFISDCLTTQQAVGDTIKNWLEAGNVGAVMSAGLLKLIPYGDTTCVGNGYTFTPPTQPAFTLTADNILPWTDSKTGKQTSEDPIQVTRVAARDAYNYVQAEWTNRANGYNNELTQEQNDAFIRSYGLRMEGSQSWHFITTQAVASWALNLRLKRNLYKRNTYKLNLPFTFSALEPMDILVLPNGEATRVTEIEDDEKGKLTITVEQFAYGSGFASIYPKQPPSSYQPNNSQALPGDTSATIFEATPQSVLAAPNTVQIAVAGSQPAWGGCDLYVSEDGTAYTKVDRILSPNRVGLLTAALASTADPDTTDTLAVDMTISGGELVTATMAEADNFVTLAAIIDRTGTMELVSFETATLTGVDRYNLTYLRRGVYGTTIGAHAIGAEFAYLGTGGVYECQYPAQYAGKLLYFKFPAFNLLKGQQQDLSVCKAYTFTIPGTTLQPPSSGIFSTNPANPLGAYAISAGAAAITVAPFVGSLNNLSAYCLPAGPYTISGVLQLNAYDVYYIDKAFAGGTITPVATQTPSDYLNKPGYYLIGSVVTPTNAGPTYYPSTFTDLGDNATQNAASAYDSDPTTYASITGVYLLDPIDGPTAADGQCIFLGLPDITPSGDNVYITYAVAPFVHGGVGATHSATIEITFDGGATWTTEVSTTAAVAKTTITVAVPSGTDLNQIQLRCSASAYVGGTSARAASTTVQLYDEHVQ